MFALSSFFMGQDGCWCCCHHQELHAAENHVQLLPLSCHLLFMIRAISLSSDLI